MVDRKIDPKGAGQGRPLAAFVPGVADQPLGLQVPDQVLVVQDPVDAELRLAEVRRESAAGQGRLQSEPVSVERRGAHEHFLIRAGERRLVAAREAQGAVAEDALVVEDDLVNQRVAKMMLENMGCTVDVASSGEEAVALFETRVYDLVLVDCRMSGMDGYQTTAALRKMEAGERHTPIVAVSADTSDGVRERCLEAGCSDFATKPIAPETLVSLLSTWGGPGGNRG